MSTNDLSVIFAWDFGYFEDILKNPTRPLPSHDEIRPHLSCLFSSLHKNCIPELSKATKIALPSRPSFPARDRSEPFEDHERRCHLMTLDYVDGICAQANETVRVCWKIMPTLQLVNTKLQAQFIDTPIPNDKEEPVKRVSFADLASPSPTPSTEFQSTWDIAASITSEEDMPRKRVSFSDLIPTCPTPSTKNKTANFTSDPNNNCDKFTYVPVSALFSPVNEEKPNSTHLPITVLFPSATEEKFKSIPVAALFSPHTEEETAGAINVSTSVQLNSMELPERDQYDEDYGRFIDEIMQHNTPASSSSSSLPSSSINPFAYCDVPRMKEHDEQENEKEQNLVFKFEVDAGGAAFRLSSTVINTDAILYGCSCRKEENKGTEKPANRKPRRVIMKKIMEQIPGEMTDELADIIYQISVWSEAVKAN